MRTTRISSGGQITIPADVRKRWGTANLVVEDLGDRIVLRPIPPDPIGAAIGSLEGKLPPSERLRADSRREEAEVERKRLRSLGW